MANGAPVGAGEDLVLPHRPYSSKADSLDGVKKSRRPPFAEPRSDARHAENLRMLKRLIRDLWEKRTEKKALNPEMRNMLVGLDGVYEQESSNDSRQTTDPEQPVGETHRR